MSITSLSNSLFTLVSAPAASAPSAAVSATASGGAVEQSCGGHEHRRRNVLFDAMMSALRELGLTANAPQPTGTNSSSTPATPGASTPASSSAAAEATPAVGSPSTAAGEATAAVTDAPASAPKANVEDAVRSFAHALWQALRGNGDGGSGRGRGDDDEHAHHHHHRHHHGERSHGMGGDYSRMATRLEALATRLDANAAATPAAPATGLPVTTPVINTDPAAEPATATPAAEPTAAASTPTAAAQPAVATPTKNPLVEAFTNLLNALRGTQPTPSSPSEAQPTLAAFLHALAHGLDGDVSAPSMSAVGGMINVSA